MWVGSFDYALPACGRECSTQDDKLFSEEKFSHQGHFDAGLF